MQLNTGKSQFGMIGMLKDIVAKEGVGRLYKGIAAPFAMEAPKRATKCESGGSFVLMLLRDQSTGG